KRRSRRRSRRRGTGTPPRATRASTEGRRPRSPQGSRTPAPTPQAAAKAAAGAPSVEVRRLGSSEVGTSCPRSASRLAAPIARTPGPNQRQSTGSAASSAIRRSLGDTGGRQRTVEESRAAPTRHTRDRDGARRRRDRGAEADRQQATAPRRRDGLP